MKPGVYPDIPNSDYHGGPGISKSGLDVMSKSPAHFQHSRTAEREETAAQRLGSLFHCLVLEPDKFWQEYARPFEAPAGALKTSDDIKARLAELGEKTTGTKPVLMDRLRKADPDAVFLEDARAEYDRDTAGRIVVSSDELARAEAMRDAVFAHPAASKWLAPGSGVAELSCYWRDPITGELCRCRPDYWRHDGVVVDLKSARDASQDGFRKSVQGWRYYVQHPYYLDGMTAALEQSEEQVSMPKPRAFVFVAVESVEPHAVGVYVLDPIWIEMGRTEYRADLDLFAECKRTETWPAYSEKVEEISPPEWRVRQYEFEHEEGIIE